MGEKSNDISFTINSGDHKGDVYKFTLAEVDGKKAWKCIPLCYPPPSMIKERIEIIVTAREKNIASSGAMEFKRIGKIMEELNVIFAETTNVTLTGFDREKYSILVDKEGPTMIPMIHEKESEPEYQASMLCWGRY